MDFDSSYKWRFNIILNRMIQDRTFTTFLLALVLIVTMGLVRPDKPEGVPGKRFWAMKISWQDYADMVITGDSRVLGGVSPGQFKQILGDKRIVNYAFASNLYEPEYLQAIEQVLNPQSSKKTIILGITPHSLTEDPQVTYQFYNLKRLSKRDIFVDTHFAALIDFFDYMSFRDAVLGFFPGLKKQHTLREFFTDGWLAYSKNPPGKKKELKTYRMIYERCQVSPVVIENVMKYVCKWTESGIRVYGFVVPTCQQMVDMEKELSGFNQAEFVDAFKEAGGIWIDIDPIAYDSFDGSHLQSQSASELSRDLALKIYEVEQQEEKCLQH